MISFLKKYNMFYLKLSDQLRQGNHGPLLLKKIYLEYTRDAENAERNLKVYCNGKNIGYIRRGNHYGFWFHSELGGDIFDLNVEMLKERIFLELQKYQRFFRH